MIACVSTPPLAARDCSAGAAVQRPFGLLLGLQHLLGAIYDIQIGHDVRDFVVTDRRVLPLCARPGRTDEQLIVAEQDDGIAVSLYLDPQLLERLQCEDPFTRLYERNIADYWTVLEGVSHFLYVAWNAGHDRQVSLLELELQAEVDKYAVSYWLLRRQLPGHFPAELPRLLFERCRVDEALAAERVDIYRSASRYALKFCRRLERSLRSRGGQGELQALVQLRRFYRLGDARKRSLIERQEA